MGDTETSEPRQSIWRRIVIVAPLLVGAGILAYAIQSRQPPPQDPPAERVWHVRAIEATPLPVAPYVAGYGTVRPDRVWNAIAQVGGQITYVHPDLRRGALIEENTVVVRIDGADLESAIAEAEANIRSASARLDELTITGANFEKALEIERKSLELRQTQLKRRQELEQRGAATALQVEQELRDTLAQERRVIDIESQLRLLPAQKDVQRAQIAINNARLATAKLNLSRTEIRAPFTGRVSETAAEVTQFAQAGSRLAVIDSIAVAEIEAQFPVDALAQFVRATFPADVLGEERQVTAELARATGFHAIVQMLGGPDSAQWRGQIARVSDSIDPQTRTIGLIITVEGSYAKAEPGVRPPLAKGMFVRTVLRSNKMEPQFVVPVSAVREGSVHVAGADNRLSARAVTTGLRLGDFVVVQSGLEGGERVVVSDLTFVMPNMLLGVTIDEKLQAQIAAHAAGPTDGEQRR